MPALRGCYRLVLYRLVLLYRIRISFLRWKMRGVRWLWMGRSGSILAREGAGVGGVKRGRGYSMSAFERMNVKHALSKPTRIPSRSESAENRELERRFSEREGEYERARVAAALREMVDRRTVGRETRGGDEAKTA